MSDSGIGRELHVVVGQGQLDAVLSARPEDRRAFVEEAAGVLKHKKRKEKALRKLEAMQANLTRLSDLTVELRRQLKPLGRQAEVARRAQQVQADLRDARLRLLADDLVQLRAALEAEVRDETAVRERRAEVETSLAAASAAEAALEQAAADQAPQLARAQETWYLLSALEERLRGTAGLAAERRRHLAAPLPEQSRSGREPDALDREAAAVRAQEAELARSLAADAERLRDAVTRRTDLEASLATEEKALVAAVRAVADRREGLARLHGQVGALRSRAAAASAELGRLAGALGEAHERSARARAELAALQEQAGGLDEGEVGLDERHEAAQAEADAAAEELTALTAQEREAERERHTWAARRDALALSLRRKDGAGALLAADLPGVLGSVAGLVQVEPGAETAVAAALGALADAVAVSGPGEAAAALTRLKADDAGRAGLLVGGGGPPEAGERRPLPAGARWALDLVQAPDALRGALSRALAGVAVVDDLPQAHRLAETGLRAVTLAGDLLGADWAVGGSASAPSLLEVQAAVDEAAGRHDEAELRHEQLVGAVAAARERVERSRAEVAAALGQLHDSDARMAALAEQLGLLASADRAAEAEAGRLEQARVRAEEARDRDLSGLADLEERLAAAEAAPLEQEPSSQVRDRLAVDASAARTREVEVRLAVRTGEERARGLAGRADALERAARQERAARERLVAVRAARDRGAAVAEQVVLGAQLALQEVASSLAAAAQQREQLQDARTATAAELQGVRARTRELAAELDRLTDVVHRDEVARAEQRLRIETLEARAVQEEAVPLDRLLTEYGPEVPVPGAAEGDEAAPYDRAAQQARLAAAERALALLGRVNPLALEEYAALEERSAFLTTQLEDLKDTRRDLLTVVKEVDDRIHDVFAAAFEDTAREFVHVFATLFPGGEGRLVLTEPDDLLATGIEVDGPPRRQEGQPAVAAVRRRAVADRHRPAGGDLPGAAVAVLRHGRGGGGARRPQPRPAARAARPACGRAASSSSSPTRSARWRSPTRCTA